MSTTDDDDNEEEDQRGLETYHTQGTQRQFILSLGPTTTTAQATDRRTMAREGLNDSLYCRWVLQLGAYNSQSPTTTHKAPNDGLYHRWGLGKLVTGTGDRAGEGDK
jgi:hypothetical protein